MLRWLSRTLTLFQYQSCRLLHLKCSGRVIVSGTIPDPGNIKANDTTMLDVPVKVPHSMLVSLGKDIGADWDIDYTLELGLTIDLPVIGNFTIPLSHSGEIKLPSLSDLWKGDKEAEETEMFN
ncbi:hypothetical protein HAX54_028757 [Datura stramonium]|uniref:Water stress and hypersensitive response domain-containing protein n=1 Tax=Datura stramonium TaxID=4076 RepID=A0ABS8S9Q9_DATST|nr:hypothetical protein [Datura stramonium]